MGVDVGMLLKCPIISSPRILPLELDPFTEGDGEVEVEESDQEPCSGKRKGIVREGRGEEGQD